MADEVDTKAQEPTAALAALSLERSPPAASTSKTYPPGQNPKLRYKKPYWWPYRTFVKQRWIGRELLEVVSTEFRDRSVDYYRHALESGVTKVNGVIAWPEMILRNGDRIDNTVHRHEPPITNDAIMVLDIDKKRDIVVISKPGSIPVHATGRYFRHTVLEILKSDHGIHAYAVNRLDRLTSGLMIMALTSAASRDLAEEFASGGVKKEYVARVRGKFPEEEIEVDQPLLTVDRQMGLVIVTPEGKEARTIFKRMSYDEKRNQSVVHCRPMTGRTHQLRVHLQYLGYPIANDPLYSGENIWGNKLGKGGVELVAPAPDDDSKGKPKTNPFESRIPKPAPNDADRMAGNEAPPTGGTLRRTEAEEKEERDRENIDLTSPILLSAQARNIIAKLRKQKDEQEDWVKWKEVVFKVKAAQDDLESATTPSVQRKHPKNIFQSQKAVLPDPLPEDTISPLERPEYLPTEGFCEECFVPLPDDPDAETLFIYLHAMRYTTEKLGMWETPLPRWAGENWDGDWRGWAD